MPISNRQRFPVNKKSVKYTVIVPFVCQDDNLRRCLMCLAESIRARTDVELVLVDNNVAAAETATLNFPLTVPCRIVKENTPGAYAARNRGIMCSSGEIVVFCDADCFVDSGWFSALEQGIETADAVCGICRVFQPGKWWDFLQSRLMCKWNHESERTGSFRAGTAMVRKSVFARIGLFDENFKYSGDLDFGLRIHAAGLRLKICRLAVSAHRPRGSLRSIAQQYLNYGYGNGCILKKWGGISPDFVKSGWEKIFYSGYHSLSCAFYFLLGWRLDRTGRKRLRHFLLSIIDLNFFIGYCRAIFF